MNRVAVALVCLPLATSAASAQTRPYTPQLTCAAVKAIVARERAVVLGTSPQAYEKVYLDSGACQGEVTSAPAFEPTIDDPNCFAGYRCKQRSNEGSSTR
jgi:hypothetical protein